MKELNVDFSQKGLAYFPDSAIYCTYYVGDHGPESHSSWQALAQKLDAYCSSKGLSTVVIFGVGFELWDAWRNGSGIPRPKGMGSKDTLDALRAAFANTGGDLWFHIKSDSAADAGGAHDIIETHLKDAVSKPPIVVRAEKRPASKVLGGRFVDGLENSADAEDLSSPW